MGVFSCIVGVRSVLAHNVRARRGDISVGLWRVVVCRIRGGGAVTEPLDVEVPEMRVTNKKITFQKIRSSGRN